MLKSLSILIPAYDVVETLPQVLENARQVGLSLTQDLEIVVVDDGSTDETPDFLKNLSKQWKELRIITHSVNRGYGVSIRDLYLAGTKEWLVTLPGDDQIDAMEILKLTSYSDKADMILGKREIRDDHFKRRLQSKTYNNILRFLFKIPITDVNTIRLMKRDILSKIKLTKSSPFIDTELIIRAMRQGFKVIEVPILHKSRKTAGATGGKFFATIWPTIKDMCSFYFKQNV